MNKLADYMPRVIITGRPQAITTGRITSDAPNEGNVPKSQQSWVGYAHPLREDWVAGVLGWVCAQSDMPNRVLLREALSELLTARRVIDDLKMALRSTQQRTKDCLNNTSLSLKAIAELSLIEARARSAVIDAEKRMETMS